MAALHELVDAGFLIADAGHYLGHPAAERLCRPLRVGQQRPGQHDHVARRVAQRLLAQVGIAELAHRHNRDLQARVRLHAAPFEELAGRSRYLQEAARRHERRRMREPPVVVTAQIDVESVHAGRDQIGHELQGHPDRALAAEPSQRPDRPQAIAVGLLQSGGELDPVHDRVVRPGARADLPHHVQAEPLPAGVAAELAPVESRIGELVEEVALVAVKVDAVDLHRLGVRGRLPRRSDDPPALAIREPAAQDAGEVEVRVPRSRDRQAMLGQQTFGRTDPAQAGGELDEEAGPGLVAGRGDVAPAREDAARAVDAGEVRDAAGLGDGRVHGVADRHQARGDEPGAALSPLGEVADHTIAGAARLFRHRDVAHGPHDDAVLHPQAIDLDRREETLEGVQRRGEASPGEQFVAQKP